MGRGAQLHGPQFLTGLGVENAEAAAVSGADGDETACSGDRPTITRAARLCLSGAAINYFRRKWSGQRCASAVL